MDFKKIKLDILTLYIVTSALFFLTTGSLYADNSDETCNTLEKQNEPHYTGAIIDKTTSCVFTFKSGKKRKLAYYSNGLTHGEHKRWDMRGVLREKGNFKNGRRDGRWEIYDKKGALAKVIMHKNGDIDGLVEQWQDGQKIESIRTVSANEHERLARSFVSHAKSGDDYHSLHLLIADTKDQLTLFNKYEVDKTTSQIHDKVTHSVQHNLKLWQKISQAGKSLRYISHSTRYEIQGGLVLYYLNVTMKHEGKTVEFPFLAVEVKGRLKIVSLGEEPIELQS